MRGTHRMHPFEQFLEDFIPKVSLKNRQLNKVLWILETTGSSDAGDLKAELDTELRMLYNDPDTYAKLLKWDQDPALKDPILKRQLNMLIRAFKENIIPPDLLEEISKKEAALLLSYANFRPKMDGRALSENDIRDILKKEQNVPLRKQAWEASKQIGEVLAPQILNLVALRNKAAQAIGYPDYFQMQLDLQEVDEKWLFSFLEKLAEQSKHAYESVFHTIEDHQSGRFNVSKDELGPWAWSEPFCQEDPIDTQELDSLVDNIDICDESVKFYKNMGIDIVPILNKSDMFERPGKNQHAFCINVDRDSDIRTLNNVKQNIKWFETVLHEFGHAIYEMGYNSSLPWLLKQPPHMLTTEAMALIAGRQAYLPQVLQSFKKNGKQMELIKKAGESLSRRQLIFSRWVLVMTYFERELYRNPQQDLNKLWWQMVNKYQLIRIPKNRAAKSDWAAKYHMGLAPVYYYSYLLGEVFASSINKAVASEGSQNLSSQNAGHFLQQKLFHPGASLKWSDLVVHVIGEPLTAEAWIKQFTN
jgi:peptidyl-dipeptidase A